MQTRPRSPLGPEVIGVVLVVIGALFLVRNAGLIDLDWGIVWPVGAKNVPFLQQAFRTQALGPGDWLLCAAVASSALWLMELRKLVAPARNVAA